MVAVFRGLLWPWIGGTGDTSAGVTTSSATPIVTVSATSATATGTGGSIAGINVNPRTLNENNRNWQRLAALGLVTQDSTFSVENGTGSQNAVFAAPATASGTAVMRAIDVTDLGTGAGATKMLTATASSGMGLWTSFGTAALAASSSFLATANNLSDVTAAVARTNLALGTGSGVTFATIVANGSALTGITTSQIGGLGNVATNATAALGALLGTPAAVTDATTSANASTQLNALLAVLRTTGIIT